MKKTLFTIVIFFLIGSVAFSSDNQFALENSSKARNALVIEFEAIDGQPYRKGTISEIISTCDDFALVLEQRVRDTIDEYHVIMQANIDNYLDWFYSFDNSSSLILNAVKKAISNSPYDDSMTIYLGEKIEEMIIPEGEFCNLLSAKLKETYLGLEKEVDYILSSNIVSFTKGYRYEVIQSVTCDELLEDAKEFMTKTSMSVLSPDIIENISDLLKEKSKNNMTINIGFALFPAVISSISSAPIMGAVSSGITRGLLESIDRDGYESLLQKAVDACYIMALDYIDDVFMDID